MDMDPMNEALTADAVLLQVDRIEEGLVILTNEGEEYLELPKALLPTRIHPGSMLRLRVERTEGRSIVRFEDDRKATADVMARHRQLLKELRERG